MKIYILIAYFFLLNSIVIAQIVDIPDPNFKNALVNTLCVSSSWENEGEWTADVNNDGEIQVSEAEAIVHLKVSVQDIESLRGIEAFIGLKSLACGHNQLTSLDVSQNTSLIYLSCGNSQITNINITKNSNLVYLNCSSSNLQEIDVSQNLNLEKLICINDGLQNLDISQNTNLQTLYAGNNELSSIDVTNNLNLRICYIRDNFISEIDLSQNTNLIDFDISNNNLSHLDVSNNLELRILTCPNNPIQGNLDLSAHNNDMLFLRCESTLLTSINIKNGDNLLLNAMWANDNPNLTCIQVDDVAYSNNRYCDIPSVSGWCKDETANYSEDCLLGITDQVLQEAILVYPNPVKNSLQINTQNNVIINKIKVYDVLGKRVLVNEATRQLDISELASGLLLVQIETNKGVITKKIIKQ